MRHMQTYQVYPDIPRPLAFLETLARNLWWCWNMSAIELFRRIDIKGWRIARSNPVLFLTTVPAQRLAELAEDQGFLAHLQEVREAFEASVHTPPETADTPYGAQGAIAYFSMEFGLHESLPLFAGGLGILAGDHLKGASDLRLPLCSVGLFYRSGYFHQYLNPDGWQQEGYPESDIFELPVERARDAAGNEVHVSVNGPPGDIRAAVWKVAVGRTPLFLLDTNLEDNPPEIRELTSRLYVANAKIRLAQEALLGIGGLRALTALDIHPMVIHLNEGHCSLAVIEWLKQIKTGYGLDLATAREIVRRTTVFTTHTPVAAGHDEFPPPLVKPYLLPFEADLTVSADEILSWGQPDGAAPEDPLSMFVLGLRLSRYCNGVSRLHGKTARKMWGHVWPHVPEADIPIAHITNGVHIPSWISVENAMLFERHLGPDWARNSWQSRNTEPIGHIYDEELWRAHEMGRARLVRFSRERLARQYGRRNAPKAIMDRVKSLLDQDALTIVFARRFATYKRASLILKDPDRLEKILTSPDYPVQLIFAGKAHPKDTGGKELIKTVFQFAQRPSVFHRVVFLEDYDIQTARYLMQGADVWLNTPRRPFEACGTSGIKAAANGVLNLSIRDGWWCEGYDETTGWSIGQGEAYEDPAYQDEIESQALYNLLENDVIPCFFERNAGNIPERWLQMMKASMGMALDRFCANAMVNRYEQRYYRPAAEQFSRLLADGAADARKLAAFRQRLYEQWQQVRAETPVRESKGPFRVGEHFTVSASIFLGDLRPDEVDVELYYGIIKGFPQLLAADLIQMQVDQETGNGHYRYACQVACRAPGRYGFTARVTPRGDAPVKHAPGLITWA